MNRRLVTLLLAATYLGTPACPHLQASTPSEAVDYMIVVTGSELLNGVYADGHTHFITRTLRPLGLRCVGSLSVDDKPEDLTQALRFAVSRAKLVLVTGGLGPTDSDITRETLSAFTAIDVREHPEALGSLERRFHTTRDQLRANLRRQTQVPVKGGYLKNDTGTAVGLIFESTDAIIVALPGPPRELQPMVRRELIPYLSRRFGTRMLGCSITLRFVGIGQSGIDQVLKDHVALPPDVMQSSQFTGSQVDFTFALPSDTPENHARLEQLKTQIVEHLGEYFFGPGNVTLEEHVAELLQSHQMKIALAEVGSGGALAAAFNSTALGQQVVAGAFVAPTEQVLGRLLKPDGGQPLGDPANDNNLTALARAARAATGSSWGVAIGASSRNEDGSRYINVAHDMPTGQYTRRLRIGSDGEIDQARLATQLLDQIRRMPCLKHN